MKFVLVGGPRDGVDPGGRAMKPTEPPPPSVPVLAPSPITGARWTVHVSLGGHVGVWDHEARAWVWGRTGRATVPLHKRQAESIAGALNAGRLRPLPPDASIPWIAPPQ